MKIVYTNENKKLKVLGEMIDSCDFRSFLMNHIDHMKKYDYGIDRLQEELVKKYINQYFSGLEMFVTDKVEHANGIGNNNKYYVQDVSTGELFGCINLNTDMFGGMYFSAEDINGKMVSSSYSINDWGIKVSVRRCIDWDLYSFKDSKKEENIEFEDTMLAEDSFLKCVRDINTAMELIEEAIAEKILIEGPKDTLLVCKRYGDKESWELVNKLEAAIDLLNQDKVDLLKNAIEEQRCDLTSKIRKAAEEKNLADEKENNLIREKEKYK